MHDVSDHPGRPVELRSLTYAVVDVETTGTRVNGGDRIMEVAVVHLRDGVATTAAEFLVNPQAPVHPWVARLTGLRWDMLHEAPTFGDVAERVWEALDVDVFVAHNVRFDWRFLGMELKRATGRTLRGRRLCTVKVARKVLPHLPRRNLDALAFHYEVPFVGRRHRAGTDARATASILDHLFRDARRQDVDTWDQLQEMLRRARPAAPRSYLPQPVRDEWVA